MKYFTLVIYLSFIASRFFSVSLDSKHATALKDGFQANQSTGPQKLQFLAFLKKLS
jgi:hypothetical protein